MGRQAQIAPQNGLQTLPVLGFRRDEGFGWDIGQDPVHQIAPERRDNQSGDLLLHGGVVVVAHPSPNYQIRSITKNPSIAVVV